MSTRQVGDSGEEVAARHLSGKGYEILARNWRTRRGEIDLISRDPEGVLVFVEVKLRRGMGYGDPLEAVTSRKQETLRAVAGEYLASLDGGEAVETRFDVIGILSRGAAVRVQHVENAL